MVKWRTMYRVILSVLMCLMAAQLALPAAQAQNERLVLAFYYAWYDQNTSWSAGQLSDRPVQPYDSRDRATIQRHVAQAKSAGIDAFVQSWYGPTGGANNMTESNFAALLDVAAQSGFRAAVDFETTGPFFGSAGDVQSALSTLLSGHARHPAYLKVNGRPVVFFWRQQRLSVDEWAALRKQVDPNHASLWIAEGTEPAYLRVFDGIHFYSVAWSADPASSLASYAARVRKTAQDLGGFRYWVAPVMPGYDDTRLRGAGGFSRPRDNGNYYRATWAGAAQSGADWVSITSFNEWPEGSQIEPSVSYGDTYLNLTRELAAAYRAGAGVAPAALAAPLAAMPAVTATARLVATATPLPSRTPTSSPTASPSPTASATATAAASATATATASATPTVTASATVLPRETPAPTVAPVAQADAGRVSGWGWGLLAGGAVLLGAALGGVVGRRRKLSA